MDPNIELVLARPTESLALAQMSRDLIEGGLRWSWKPSRILGMIRHPDCVVLVARTRVEIAGFAIMEFHEVHAHLNLLAVKTGQRREGIGKALIEWLEQSCRVAGIASIFLEVRAGNDDAKKFYESLGYKPGKIVEGYYQGREDALTMVHQLMAPEIASQRP
jgi:ribosomal-protein-alanine acetyltransferase